MPYTVDIKNVSTVGLESSPVAEALAGLRANERNIAIASRPLEVSSFEVDGTRMAYVFYESGLAINVPTGVPANSDSVPCRVG
jgi:hypothetical protein